MPAKFSIVIIFLATGACLPAVAQYEYPGGKSYPPPQGEVMPPKSFWSSVFKRRTQVEGAQPPPVAMKVAPPYSRAEVLMSLSQDTIDTLKAQIDEWGTLVFAPPIMAPPQYYKGDNTDPQAPFKLKETENANPNPFTLDVLYGSYNASHGQSAYGERTSTKTSAAVEANVNELERTVVEGKLKLMDANLKRNRTAVQEKASMALARVNAAGPKVTAAQGEAAAAAATVAVEQRQVDQARAALLRAQQNLVGAAPTEEKALKDEAEKARLAVTVAEAGLTRATTLQTAANNKVTAARVEVAEAKADYAAAATAALSFPGNTNNALPSTAAGGSGAPATSGVDSITVADMRRMSGAADIEKVGTKADGTATGTADLPRSLNPGETTAGGAGTGSFSPLDRINSAAAALTVKNVLSYLGNPDPTAFDGKKLMFAVSTLSVNPGWRTRRDFKAVIDGTVKIDMMDASAETIREVLNDPEYPVGLRKLIADRYRHVLTPAQREFFEKWAPPPAAFDEPPMSTDPRQAQATPAEPALRAGKAPELADYKGYICLTSDCVHRRQDLDDVVVAAVSPMVDSQNLDLASSIARQDEIALFLSASLAQAGSSGAGRFFSSWVKERRKDVATRTSVATANSYSMGDHFGFEVGTRLRGLDEDNAKGDKAAQILGRQTIPVLFIVGLPRDKARPVLEVEHWNDVRTLKVRQPRLVLDYSTRWARQQHGFWSFLKENRSPRDSAQEILRNAMIRQAAADRQDALDAYERDLARQRWEEAAMISQMTSGKSGPVYTIDKACVPTPDGTAAAKASMGREYEAIVDMLYGMQYRLPLPGKWLTDNLGPDVRTDLDLHDPDVVVQENELKFDPPLNRGDAEPPLAANQPLIFARLGAARTLVIKGPKVRELDAAGLTTDAQCLGIVKDSIRQTTEAISVTLVATRAGRETVTLHLPYRQPEGTDPAFLSRMAVTMKTFECVVAEPPQLADWEPAKLLLPGALVGGKWHAQHVEVIVRGKNLGLLGKTKCFVRGVGFESKAAPVTISNSGPDAVVVKFDLTSAPGQGELMLHFDSEEAQPKVSVFTKPLPFQFVNAAQPVILPWSGAEQEITVAEHKTEAGLWQFPLRVKGENLHLLKKDKAGLKLNLSFECKSQDVTVRSAEPGVLLLWVELRAPETHAGNLQVIFEGPRVNAADGKPEQIPTGPMTVNLLKN